MSSQKSFLKSVSERIYEEHRSELDKVLIIVPSTRAGRFIYNHLKTLISNNIITYALNVYKYFDKKEVSKKVKNALINMFKNRNVTDILIKEGEIAMNTMTKFKRIVNESNKTF